jgi:hypothetical protein
MEIVPRGALAAMITAVAVSVTGGVASAAGTNSSAVPCTTRSTSEYFSAWGDTDQYFVAPGGAFQLSGAQPWTAAGGATTVANGDPWNVLGVAKPESAWIPSGGSETSMQFCVTSTESAIRFFYRSPGVAGSALTIAVNVSSGTDTATNTLSINGSTSGWAVSQTMSLPAIYNPQGQELITIAAAPTNNPATWQVDDVMVDPFASR